MELGGLPVVELEQAAEPLATFGPVPITVVVEAMSFVVQTWCGRGATARRVGAPAVQMPEHTRTRDEAHVEAATTGFVSQGLREVRFPDMRWTLNRPTVELTDLMLICRRAIWGLAGDGGPADGHIRRHSARA